MNSNNNTVSEERRKYFIENLDRALDEGWIVLYYQPVIRGSNERICFEEALARWVEPGKPMALPDEFIPVLEDEGIVHRIDLYMIDQILSNFRIREASGLQLLPVSVNLSRCDFDGVNLAEEIRSRVDGAGIDRSMLYLEITESVLGSDFDYMSSEIKKLRDMGFKVCLDDFGSGYSSLSFLKNIDVDIIKLDLNFMKEFRTNEKTRIIVSQLMRLVSSLAIDSVAEGVENPDEFEFLKESGCSKMQGYYFCEPLRLEEIIEHNTRGDLTFYIENPEESDYYEKIGRVSLFSLDGDTEETGLLSKYFDTIPVAILEYNGESVHLVRCNHSYKKFLSDTFGVSGDDLGGDHAPALHRSKAGIFELFKRSRNMDRRLLFEERISDKATINGFIRHTADNEITGYSAYTLAILKSKDFESNSGVSFALAAKALSADYIHLYYVNDKTDEFTEYNPDASIGNLSVERRGSDFFNASIRDAETAVHPDDRETFKMEFSKEYVLRILELEGTYSLSYRLMKDGEPLYVNMKAVRIDSDHIVIGVNNVDSYMRHKEELERAQEESLAYARISALSGDFIAMYTVDPDTDGYMEYSSTGGYEDLGLAKTGQDFFGETRRLAGDIIHAEDLEGFKLLFTKDNVLRDIEDNGLFEFNYRMMIGDEAVHVSLKAAMVEEKTGQRIIVGISNIDERIKRSQEYETSLREAREMIMVDSLTGVKNKHAYLDAETELDEQIEEGRASEFAIVIMDLNGLKDINDTHGHKTGDNFLKAGCRAITDIFGKDSIYRVGGDEFVFIAKGQDYERVDELVKKMNIHNERCIDNRKLFGTNAACADVNKKAMARRMTIAAGSYDRDSRAVRDYTDASAGQIFRFDPADVVIACGMARFEGDASVADVFDRADLAMFENKKALKSR